MRTFLQGWLADRMDLPSGARIDHVELVLNAPWTTSGTGALLLATAAIALCVVTALYYLRFHAKGKSWLRLVPALCRGLLLSLLLFSLAEPALRIESTVRREPLVYVLFDGTESMTIADAPPLSPRRSPKQAGDTSSGNERVPRMQAVQSWLRGKDAGHALARLEKTPRSYHLEPFLLDGRTTSRLRRLDVPRRAGGDVDWSGIADRLTAGGQVTALGNALSDVSRQTASGRVAAVILVSDFAHNSGPLPANGAPGGASDAAQSLPPVFTIGVGATETVDLAVDLRTELKIRKGEETTLRVDLRQKGLAGRQVTLRVSGQQQQQQPDQFGSDAGPVEVEQRDVELADPLQIEEFRFVPENAGTYRFQVEAAVFEDELLRENNVAWHQATVIEDYVRLMYVAYEPGWEWRFIKEVFHRDPNVGLQGFRTFLASSDPRVRQSNPLFLTSLTPPRREFFANDVIFLDDMPRGALSPRFGEMVREFVGRLGGGLVVLAGPRFGPGELADTPLAEMLPVILDPQATLRDASTFRLRRTARAAEYEFMQLGDSPRETDDAWRNLGPLPWYQPVAGVHERAQVLAEHPSDTCRDGRTPQPLVAVRRYGEGEVVYLGFNEFWRLRRRHGQRYYRRFWSPLIDRLGLSHALGSRKRFVPRLDRNVYGVDEEVVLTVQVFDQDYAPLPAEAVEGGNLAAELYVADPTQSPATSRALAVPFLRDGLWELRFPVYTPGTYRLRLRDPLSDEVVEQRFEVEEVSAELRTGVRNAQLQRELAAATGGNSYDLSNADRIVEDMQLEAYEEQQLHTVPLWSTAAWFLLLLALMLGEWLLRKGLRLA